MKPFVKYGLIVGLVALILIIPIAALVGLCGPVVTLVAGAFAGFLTAYFGKAATRREGGQSGSLAGAIAGAMTLLGQTIGAALALAYVHLTGTQIAFGPAPNPTSPLSEVIPYYAAGVGAGFCFGVVGLVLGALAGALAGSLGTRQTPAMPPTPVQ